MPLTALLEGLPPISDPRARVLILGTMPGVLSLASGQYYGNPRNAFWRIAADLFGFDADSPYQRRVDALRSSGVALWDVLKCCRRVGSLDSAIEPGSAVANDFAVFFTEHRSIERVFFNGAAAERNYAKLAGVDLPAPSRRLPSTSPAQTMPYPDKLAAWRAVTCS